MAGYAASSTLHGAPPRFVVTAAGARGTARDATPSVGAVMVRDGVPEPTPIELVGRPIDATIGEWLASVGESWSQLTFFLFDPHSWR